MEQRTRDLVLLLRRQVAEGDAAARRSDRGVPRTRSEQQARIAGLLTELAKHFSTVRPDAPMTEPARMTAALSLTGTATSARPLLRLLPWPKKDETREQYAQRLRARAQPPLR
ncbi:hypothetical protein [Streptomyces noursei]|uniref:hypothetical protein n=1 Tax=Streptomyces noursei TaxID=1971 RepID=UPI0038068570